MALKRHVFADYISIKLAHLTEPLTFACSNLSRMVELAEKSLKLYLAFKEKREDALSHYSKRYGHSIRDLRTQAAIESKKFDQEDIRQFSSVFDDKQGALFQHFRYGSQSNITGYNTNMNSLMSVTEKIFFHSILDHSEQDKRMINHGSAIFMLLTKDQRDQSRNPKDLIQVIQSNNPFFEEYKSYCIELAEEDQRILKQLKKRSEEK